MIQVKASASENSTNVLVNVGKKNPTFKIIKITLMIFGIIWIINKTKIIKPNLSQNLDNNSDNIIGIDDDSINDNN